MLAMYRQQFAIIFKTFRETVMDFIANVENSTHASPQITAHHRWITSNHRRITGESPANHRQITDGSPMDHRLIIGESLSLDRLRIKRFSTLVLDKKEMGI